MRRNTKERVATAAEGLVVGLMMVLGLSACGSLDEAATVRDELATLREDLDRRAGELAAAAASMDPGDPSLPAAEAAASVARARAEAIGAGVAGLDAALHEAADPSDPLSDAVQSLSGLLPQPLQAPAVLAAAAGVLAWRSSRLKSGLRSVALSIEAAKRTDEEFRRCFERHRETFRAAQTPSAQRVVRAVTRVVPAG